MKHSELLSPEKRERTLSYHQGLRISRRVPQRHQGTEILPSTPEFDEAFSQAEESFAANKDRLRREKIDRIGKFTRAAISEIESEEEKQPTED